MKRFATFCFLLIASLIGSNVFAGFVRSLPLSPASTAPVVEIAPFISPIYAPLHDPAMPLESNAGINYVDTNAKQYRYYVLPSYVNFNLAKQGDPPDIYRDTMFALSERFSAPTGFGGTGQKKVFLDSVVMILYPATVQTFDGNKIKISLHRQITGANGVLYPAPKAIDSVILDPATDLTLDAANPILIPFKRDSVGKNFFIKVSVAYDRNADEQTQNVIGIFGDSTDYGVGPYNANIHRAVIEGFRFQTSYSGFTQGGGAPYYANLYITAYVSDAALGVDDVKFDGNALAQNFPNPFNPTTEIKYSLATGGQTTMKVINALGVEVASLVNSYVASGEHTATFDGSNLPSGTYFYSLKCGEYSATKRMVLSK